MPTDERSNGLTRLSLHAYDDTSSDALEEMGDQQAASLDRRPAGAPSMAGLDPETAARRHLDQALASPAVPSLNTSGPRGVESEFRSLGVETVALTGTRTVKFRQTIGGIPVYGSLITVELDDDNALVGLDSAVGEPDDVDPVARVAPAAAVDAAAAHPGYRPELAGIVPRLHHYFDAAASQWRLVYILEDVPVAVDPAGQSEDDRTSGLEPPRFLDYVVDAHDGRVVAVLPRTPSIAAAPEHRATDGAGIERSFRVEVQGDGFVLRDPVYNVETYDFDFRDPVAEEDKLPGQLIANPPQWSPAAVSAHANASAVADFLRTVLLRDNIDDRGGAMVSTVNCVVAEDSPGPRQWHNAFWSPRLRQMVYGQALHQGSLRSLAVNVDVVAHEVFHGVTDETSRLEYADQPGALNESYSDIFGVIVSNQGEDDTRRWGWEIGENLLPGDEPLRDLSDPSRFDQPAHMDDFQDLPNNQFGDWGGVHVNSGIPNKAAFLILTAEDHDGDLVLSPGEVAGVFYLALTQRLSRTSQFVDSRRAVVASARTLFRKLPSDERRRKVAAVEAGFDAVGID